LKSYCLLGVNSEYKWKRHDKWEQSFNELNTTLSWNIFHNLLKPEITTILFTKFRWDSLPIVPENFQGETDVYIVEYRLETSLNDMLPDILHSHHPT